MPATTTSKGGPRPLLLDTHAWLWFFQGDRGQIRPPLERQLETAARDALLLVSVLSVWEIAMLEAKRRVRLSMDCRAWVRRALDVQGLRLHPLTPAVAIESTRLPGTVHGDPVDRMLIATARLAGAAIVTRDARILEYSRAGHVLTVTV